MGPIQLIPPGMMGLLQLKQFGKLPGELVESVQPVIELREWYMAANRQDLLSLLGATPTTAVITTPGIKSFVGPPSGQVPDGFVWWVDQCMVRTFTTSAGDVARFAAVLINKQATSWHALGPDVSDYLALRSGHAIEARAERGFWAFPGDVFGVDVLDISSAVGLTFSLYVRATQMKI